MKNKKSFFPDGTAVIGGVLTAVICGVMNFILIPKIETSTQGIRCFDMNFGYSYETAQKFLSLIGDEGRIIYLNRQLPLDFVYPVFYTLFFISLIYILAGRKKKPLLPFLPAVCLPATDYIENIMSIIMLRSGIPSKSFALISSCVTSVKTVLMYITGLIIAVMLLINIVRAIKRRKEQ